MSSAVPVNVESKLVSLFLLALNRMRCRLVPSAGVR
jgi:hypothetical protein